MSLRAADLDFWRRSNLAIVAGIASGKTNGALAMTKMNVISEIEQVYHETEVRKFYFRRFVILLMIEKWQPLLQVTAIYEHQRRFIEALKRL
jgi:hypothetical protein